MLKEFTGSSSDLDLVKQIADEIYPVIAIAHLEPMEVIHARGVCIRASNLFFLESEKIWYQSNVMLYQGDSPLDYHYHNGFEEEWNLDLTWQQHLYSHRVSVEQIDRSLPKVFIARRKNLPQELTGRGIPASLHRYWTKAKVAYPLPVLGDRILRA